MDRSFSRGFILGFIIFTALPAFFARASDRTWKSGDLLRLDCRSPRASVPRYLEVQEVSDDGAIRLGRVEDRVFRKMLTLLESESGGKFVDEFQGLAWNPETERDEPVNEGAVAVAIKQPGGSLQIEHDFVAASPSSSESAVPYRGTFSMSCDRRRSSCTAIQMVESKDRSPRSSAPREEFSCGVKRLVPCEWLAELKAQHVSKRTEVLKQVGEDNWKQAFDAEQIEKATGYLMTKYDCPVFVASVRIE